MNTLGPIGLASSNPYTDDAAVVADEARHAESLGFSTLWRSGNLPMLDVAVRATKAIPVATGIIPVSEVPAADVIATYRALQRDHPRRFIVGLGGARNAHPLETLEHLPRRAGLRGCARLDEGAGRARAQHAGAGTRPGLRCVPVSGHAVLRRRRARRARPDRLLAVLLMVMPVDRSGGGATGGGGAAGLPCQGGRLSPQPVASGILRDRHRRGQRPAAGRHRRMGRHSTAIAARVAEYRAAGADQVVLRILGVDDPPCRRRGWREALIG